MGLVTNGFSGASTSMGPGSPLDSPSASSTLSLLPLLPCQEPTCSSVESPSTPEVSPTNLTSSSPSKTDLSPTWTGGSTSTSASSPSSPLSVWSSSASSTRRAKRRTLITPTSTPSETTDLIYSD